MRHYFHDENSVLNEIGIEYFAQIINFGLSKTTNVCIAATLVSVIRQ